MTTAFKQTIDQKKEQIKNQFRHAIEPLIGGTITADYANTVYRQLFAEPELRKIVLHDDFKGFSVTPSVDLTGEIVEEEFDTTIDNSIILIEVREQMFVIVSCLDYTSHPDGYVVALLV